MTEDPSEISPIRALILALDEGERLDPGRFEQLLAAVPDVDATDASNWRPLKRAIHGGCAPAVLERLIARGADVNAKPVGFDEPSALESAVLKGRADLVDVLLRHGASPRPYRSGDPDPLGNACTMKDLPMSKLLLDVGAPVDGTVPKTPLMSAAQRSAPELVALLLERGADVSRADREGRTALSWAAGASPYDCAPAHYASIRPGATKEEIAKAMEPPPPPTEEMLARHEEKIIEVVRMLLEAGADPNAQDRAGQPPLAKVKTASVAKLLIDRGARTDLRDRRKQGVHEWLAWTRIPLESLGLPPAGAATSEKQPRGSATKPPAKRRSKG